MIYQDGETYDLGVSDGVEQVIDAAIADMRQALADWRKCMKNWTPDKRTVWAEVAKVNKLGLELHDATGVAATLIERWGSKTTVPDYTPVWAEITDVYERLSSWDLYRSFGWKEFTRD